MWTRHLAALLTLAAFVLLAAAYVPCNSIKARLHHPMVLGVKVWAFAHLLANGTLADLLLFGGFLAWCAWLFIHVAFLVGFENRLLVLLQWANHYFTRHRGARLITDHAEERPRG